MLINVCKIQNASKGRIFFIFIFYLHLKGCYFSWFVCRCLNAFPYFYQLNEPLVLYGMSLNARF